MFNIIGGQFEVRFDGHGKGLLYGPSAQTLAQCMMRDIKFFSPLRNGFTLTIELYKNVSARIVGLLFFCRPSTIIYPFIFQAFRTMTARIMTVVVLAVNGMIRCRRVSHISKEVFKMSISTAHFNAATAISIIGEIVGIFTASNYRSPAIINSGHCFSMSSFCGRCSFFIVATARGCVPFFKVARQNNGLLATTTFTTIASKIIFVISGSPQYKQPAKLFARQIVKFWHTYLKIEKPFSKRGRYELPLALTIIQDALIKRLLRSSSRTRTIEFYHGHYGFVNLSFGGTI